jgi:hypothetical protein
MQQREAPSVCELRKKGSTAAATSWGGGRGAVLVSMGFGYVWVGKMGEWRAW